MSGVITPGQTALIGWLKAACESELAALADWWCTHSVADHGFIAELSDRGQVNPAADKGIILNTRLLWFFSELGLRDMKADHVALADRAYQYLVEHFLDEKFGGFYWSVAPDGKPVDEKKQTYAQAFAVYALASYFRLTANQQALEFALAAFQCLETHCVDASHGGYLEAFGRDWQPIGDVRLSEKDDNAPKTMNTHLHLLEAYTGLYIACPSDSTRQALVRNVEWFCDYFVNPSNGHLRLYLDLQWRDQSRVVSYGHDIEASWLIREALEALGDATLTDRYQPLALALASSCLAEGIGDAGQVLDRCILATGTRQPESEWWVQAEALVGFISAFGITQDEAFLMAVCDVWRYIDLHHRDEFNGEWFWYSRLDQARGHSHYKMGFWKGPYHNGRAMMEMSRRLTELSRTAEQ